MNASVVYMGIDYHDKMLQVCALDGSGQALANRPCPNDVVALGRVLGRLGGERVEAAIESCSGAAALADELVLRLGWSVSLAHPGYVRRMKQNPDKSDFSDAQMLADLIRVGYLPKVWLAPEWIRELRRLTRYRQGLVNQRRSVKQQITAFLRDQRVGGAPANRWTRRWMVWVREKAALSEQSRWIVDRLLMRLEGVKAEIKLVEERLAALVAEDRVVEALMRRRGIGLVTATVMRAEIGRFDRFHSGKQLSRFCGLSPRNASSGARQADAGLIAQCNRQLRAILIEAAHRLMRYEPRWVEMAHRMRAAGKPGSLIAAAVANRWLRRLYYEMQDVTAA